MTDAAAARLRWILVLRWVALLLAALGVVWDLILGWAYFSPGPSGEWARLTVPFAALGGFPSGLFAAVFYFIARAPASRMRHAVAALATASVLLPIFLALYDRWH